MIDFRSMARERAGDEWSRLDESERRRRIRQAKETWLNEQLEPVEAEQDYGAWLQRQPAHVQDEALGKTRARLFRKGGLTIERFSDPAGRPLTLEELAKRRPGAFTRAGLDPDAFTKDGQ